MDQPFEPGPAAPNELAELRENYKKLRFLFHSVSISLLVLTGVLFVFIYRQVVVIRKQTDQLNSEIAEFERSGAPRAIEDLRKNLYTFSQQDLNFRPIYIRYFGTNKPAAPTVAPTAPASQTILPGQQPSLPQRKP